METTVEGVEMTMVTIEVVIIIISGEDRLPLMYT